LSAAGFPGVVGTEVADAPRVVPRVSSGKVVEGVFVLVEGVFLRLLLRAPEGPLSALADA